MCHCCPQVWTVVRGVRTQSLIKLSLGGGFDDGGGKEQRVLYCLQCVLFKVRLSCRQRERKKS